MDWEEGLDLLGEDASGEDSRRVAVAVASVLLQVLGVFATRGLCAFHPRRGAMR